jgi:hypothetical protein
MATQAQNLSREMILPAYKAAISPGSPIPPESTVNCQLSTVNSLLTSTPVESPLQIRPFRAKRTQFQKHPKSAQLSFSQRLMAIQPPSAAQKQTQNEPKRTQSKPNLSPVRAPQSQNEPKQTQFPYA